MAAAAGEVETKQKAYFFTRRKKIMNKSESTPDILFLLFLYFFKSVVFVYGAISRVPVSNKKLDIHEVTEKGPLVSLRSFYSFLISFVIISLSYWSKK